MSDWIGDTFTSKVGWSHLGRLVDIGNRMTSSPDERETMEATQDALERVGTRSARINPLKIQGQKHGSSAVYAADTTQGYIVLLRSPAGTVSGELADLGYGLTEDFNHDLSGKVIVVSTTVPDHHGCFIHRREKYYYATEVDAAAFVFVDHVPGQLLSTGSVSTADAPIGDILAASMSEEAGARLRHWSDGDEVIVGMTCETPAAESENVHAKLGPDIDEEVLVTSRLDAHDAAEGTMGNGTGTTMVVKVVHTLAVREDELDARARLVCFGAGGVGLVDSECGVERPGDDRANVKAIVNNDGVVARRTLEFTTHNFDELGAAAEIVIERFDHDVSTLPEQLPHSDHWPFITRGVPAYMAGSEKEGYGRGWGHTHADTIEKLESRTLREQAIPLTKLIIKSADVDREVPHADPADITTAFEAEDQAEGMKVTGD